MHVCSIVGARPQFVKLAVVSKAIERRPDWKHTIVHTGQHYDPALSAVFFSELQIPAPHFSLDVGSGSHGEQIGEMLKRVEPVLAAEQPDWVLLFGDTNSTLAGALMASRLNMKSAHVEAGLRSHRRSMPEEANRVVSDHLGDLLLCPTVLAMENLRREGLGARAVLTGDVMFDAAMTYREMAERRAGPVAVSWSPAWLAATPSSKAFLSSAALAASGPPPPGVSVISTLAGCPRRTCTSAAAAPTFSAVTETL